LQDKTNKETLEAVVQTELGMEDIDRALEGRSSGSYDEEVSGSQVSGGN